MEIAAAAEDRPTLRAIAASLLAKASEGDVQAIKEVADRLDGKPAQESTVTIDNRRDIQEYTDGELQDMLRSASGSASPDSKANGKIH